MYEQSFWYVVILSVNKLTVTSLLSDHILRNKTKKKKKKKPNPQQEPLAYGARLKNNHT